MQLLHIVGNILTTHDVLYILIYSMINITTNVKRLIHSLTGSNKTQIREGPSVTAILMYGLPTSRWEMCI